MSAYTWRDLARDLREGRYTSLGSYPKFWVTAHGSVISYDAIMGELCRYMRATAGKCESWDREAAIVGCDVNWEDADLYCDHTGQRIPSAYAEPES